jgi:predicted transcriptional regulator
MNRKFNPTYKNLSHPAQHLWNLFERIKDHKTNRFWYSINTLHEITSYDKRVIMKAISELKEKGIISIDKNYGKTNKYKVLKHYSLY